MLSQSYAPVPGGVERIVEVLSGELVARGHEVLVATLRQPADSPPPRSADGVELHVLDSSLHRLPGVSFDPERRHAPPAPDPETVLGLRRLLREWRPDVVHAHDWLLYSFLPLDRKGGPGLVLSMHDYGLVCAIRRFIHHGSVCSGPALRKCIDCAGEKVNYGPAKGPALALAVRGSERRARRHIDMFLPVSGAVERGCGLRPDEPHEVIPNFIGELPPAPADADAALAGLPDEPFVLYFGDVTHDKGVGVLLEAYGRLEGAPPLVLVGRNYLEEAASTPGVHALGALPHAVAIEAVRRSLFTVVPSILPEAFGLVALEAAAAGKPTVASAVGGLPDVVRDGETGFLVAPRDVGALAVAMGRLIGEPALRESMGARAREHAAEFRPEAIVPRFEAAYRTAIEARGAAPVGSR
jgi:glycosyltransferase involved in cell wall biosynthesis